MVILRVNASVSGCRSLCYPCNRPATCPGCSLPLALSHLIIGMHYVLISADVKKNVPQKVLHTLNVSLFIMYRLGFLEVMHISAMLLILTENRKGRHHYLTSR